ncbi:MAG: DinB family protein [Dehalococcoidia bacterium]
MSTRSQTLAEQFDQANTAAIAAIESFSDAQWRATSRDEGWPVGFVAWHIGDAPFIVMDLVTIVANGRQLPPMTAEQLDEINAQKLAAHAGAGKTETIDQLRRNGATIAAGIHALSDEQLDRTAALPMVGGRSLSAQQLIEAGIIGHIRGHLASMQAADGANATT